MKVPYFRTISSTKFILWCLFGLALGPLGIFVFMYLVRDVEVEDC